MAEEYLLVKRDLYWRPEGMGYTGIKDQAGRYNKEDAERMVGPGVTMVLLDKAPDFTGACFDDLARDHLAKQRDAARSSEAFLKLKVETLLAALQPFAQVFNILEACKENDRTVSIGFVPVHFEGSGSGGCLKTFTQEDFERAAAAIAKATGAA